MNDWSELVRLSLLGTERAAVPPLPDAQAPPRPPEEQLLARAALAAQYRRVGARPDSGRLSLQSAAPPDHRPVLAPDVVPLLADLLALDKETLPLQALARIAVGGYRLPGQALPLLLDAGAARHQLRRAVADLLGPRGRWLAAQREAWRYAAVDPRDARALEAALTPFGGDDAAFLRLAQLLDRDPARGRAVAARIVDDPRQARQSRARLMGVLADRLTPEMEPLLEAALQARQFSVRRQASVMLASLPEAGYGERMLDRLLQVLIWTPAADGEAARLALSGTVRPDPLIKRDYLRRTGPGQDELKAWEIRLLFSAIPLDGLTRRLEATPDEIIHAALPSPHGRLILRSLVTATDRQRNRAWAEALLEAPPLRSDMQTITAGLLGVLSPDEREEAARRVLATGRSGQPPRPRLHPLAALLRHCTHAWSPAFTMQVFHFLHHLLTGRRRGGSNVIFRNTIRDMAPYVDLPVAEKMLPELTALELPRVWQPAVDQLTMELQLRRRLVALLPPLQGEESR